MVVTKEWMTGRCREEFSHNVKGCSLVEAATWVKLPLQEPGQSSLNDVKKSPALGKSWLKAPVH